MKENRLHQLKAMLEAEPDDPFLLYGIAQEYVSGAEWQHAKEYFARLYAGHPEYLPTYYHYGLVLAQLNEAEAAEKVWREGVTLANEKGDGKTANEIRELLEDVLDVEV